MYVLWDGVLACGIYYVGTPVSRHNVEVSDIRIGTYWRYVLYLMAVLVTPCFNAYSTIDLRYFISCDILFMRDTPLIKVSFDELTISQGYLAFHVFNV